MSSRDPSPPLTLSLKDFLKDPHSPRQTSRQHGADSFMVHAETRDDKGPWVPCSELGSRPPSVPGWLETGRGHQLRGQRGGRTLRPKWPEGGPTVRASCRRKGSHVLCPHPWREDEVGQSGREYDIWVPLIKLPSDVRKIYCDELITPSVAGGEPAWRDHCRAV